MRHAYIHAPQLFRAVLCVLLRLNVVPNYAAATEARTDSPDLSAALGIDQECSDSPGVDSSSQCSLSALQLHRAKVASSFESAPSYQGAWVHEGPSPGDALHELLFVVKKRNAEKAKEMLLDRSNPRSADFQKWLSQKEVLELTRNDAAVQAIRSELSSHGGISLLDDTPTGDMVRARAPVATWERLLGARFHSYQHKDSRRVMARASHYSLPRRLHGHVEGVLRAVELGDSVRSAPQFLEISSEAEEDTAVPPSWNCTPEAAVVSCDSFEDLMTVKPAVVTPPKLRKAYNVDPVAQRGSQDALLRANTSQMVYASLGQHWSPSDRTKFETAFRIPQDRYVKELDVGNGKSSDTRCRENPNDCTESNLDVEYMMAMSPWSDMGYFYMSKDSTMYDFLVQFVEYMGKNPKPPSVISISYGMPEIGATPTAVKLFNNVAINLALQGTTILVASGDDGAASAVARNDRHGQCWAVDILGLQASWPASSPWVTAVGATIGPESGSPEIACSVNASGPTLEATRPFPPLITSGGGFSQMNEKPAWQDKHHSKQGRGVPDLAIAGHAYAIVIGGKWLTVDGTSASAPAFGGMVSLINAERLKVGLPLLGFLNPLLYGHPEVFNDITQGDNRCASRGSPCCGGYDAGVGWDAVSGLGSIDFKKLAAVMSKEARSTAPQSPHESGDLK